MSEQGQARLLMEMVAELHQRGYGKLKLSCYVKEGIGAWRNTLFAADRWQGRHYDDEVFGWEITNATDPQQAADEFMKSESEFLQAAQGHDPVYEAWYAKMLAFSAPDGILEMERPAGALIYGRNSSYPVAPLFYPGDVPAPDANGKLLEALLATNRIRMNPGSLLRMNFPAKPGGFDFAKVEGMLLGIAIGDSLGAPTESLLPVVRRQQYGELRDYIPNRYTSEARGFPTDDTQLSFWLVEQMLEDNGFVPENVAFRFANSGRIYGIGSTVRGFLGNFKSGLPWYECGPDSAGNGALMRIAPILLPHLRTGGAGLAVDAALAGMITHNSFASNAACVAFAVMLWELLDMDRAPSDDWWLWRYAELARELEGKAVYAPRGGRFPDFRGPLWQYSREIIRWAQARELSVLDACNHWYSGAYLLETLPSAIYILMRYADEPEEAMVRAVNDTKDNDTVAAIVGAALGALHGVEAFPKRWIANLSGRTGQDDDGRVFEVIKEAKRIFWFA